MHSNMIDSCCERVRFGIETKNIYASRKKVSGPISNFKGHLNTNKSRSNCYNICSQTIRTLFALISVYGKFLNFKESGIFLKVLYPTPVKLSSYHLGRFVHKILLWPPLYFLIHLQILPCRTRQRFHLDLFQVFLWSLSGMEQPSSLTIKINKSTSHQYSSHNVKN